MEKKDLKSLSYQEMLDEMGNIPAKLKERLKEA